MGRAAARLGATGAHVYDQWEEVFVARPDASNRGDPETPIGWFVAEIAADLGLDEAPSAARTRRAVRRLVEWATGGGTALERELIFDPDTVER